MPQSQITNIVYQNAWPSQNGGPDGNMHTSLISFADGTTGSANHKNPTPPYRIGDVQDYQIVGDFKGTPKLKVTRPQQQQQGGYQQQPAQGNYVPPAHQPQSSPQPQPQSAGNGQQSPFISGLNKLATLWCHCWDKTGVIAQKVGGLTPEQRQSACASLFIEANKKGLADGPIPQFGATAQQVQPAPPPPQPVQRVEQRAGQPAGPGGTVALSDFDESVPFAPDHAN